MNISLRSNRVPFKFAGPDAEKLLKDVLTGTVVAKAGPAHWWALLTPQGKIIAEGLVGWQDGAFWIDVDKGIAEHFFKRMRMYKLRADAEISDLASTHVVGWSENAPETKNAIVHADPRTGGLGFRVISEQKVAKEWVADSEPFTARRIAAAVAEIGVDFESETLFPHDIAMDLLGGIDFKKGCYVGQEVVSRMRHRGSARRRPVIVSGAQPGSENEVMADGKSVGQIGQVVDGRAVGILRLDRLKPASEATLNAQTVELAVPHWASYDFGESEEV